jgi:hypothetical protein
VEGDFIDHVGITVADLTKSACATSAALIYQYAFHDRDAMIADGLSEMVRKALRKPA